jgi:hypothetical protein
MIHLLLEKQVKVRLQVCDKLIGFGNGPVHIPDQCSHIMTLRL